MSILPTPGGQSLSGLPMNTFLRCNDAIVCCVHHLTADVSLPSAMTALLLGQKLQPAGRDREKMAALMDEHWSDIYKLGRWGLVVVSVHSVVCSRVVGLSVFNF